MVNDRGFIIQNLFTDMKCFEENFNGKTFDSLNFECRNSLGQIMYVLFLGANMLKGTFDSIIHDLSTKNCNQAILIHNTVLNHSIKNKVAEINNDVNMTIQLFLEEELVVNVTQHYLVPKHSLLTDAQKHAILKQ